MKQIQIQYANKIYQLNSAKSWDISIPLSEGDANPNCYFAEPVRFEVIRSGNFVGSVVEGGSVNYQKITLTPHGNGTHTECFGHIASDEQATITNCLKDFFWIAELITVTPQKEGKDEKIHLSAVQSKLQFPHIEALIVRTLPNSTKKLTNHYSNTNPPYFDVEVGKFLAEKKIKHLLTDLPSVDKEIDGGALRTHRAFWQFPENTRTDCSITELIFVPDEVPDGLYLLNLQIANIQIDASPSRPIIFLLEEADKTK